MMQMRVIKELLDSNRVLLVAAYLNELGYEYVVHEYEGGDTLIWFSLNSEKNYVYADTIVI